MNNTDNFKIVGALIKVSPDLEIFTLSVESCFNADRK